MTQNNFKKYALAASVALAVGGMAQNASAITLGEPGEALLVPYVLYDTVSAINTLVGITVPAVVGADTNIPGTAWAAGGGAYQTAMGTSGVFPGVTGTAGLVHWYFFNVNSQHCLDNSFPVTLNDWAAFDWGATVTLAGGVSATCGSLIGMPGYIIFADDGARSGAAAVRAMYGDAVMVQGNWSSAAFIPVIPMSDGTGAFGIGNEVLYAGTSFPSVYAPLSAGIPLDNDDATAGNSTTVYDMRYFLDPALGGTTNLVSWFPNNCRATAADGCDRTNVGIEVYDTEELHGSANINLEKQLNLLNATSLPWVLHNDFTDPNTAATPDGINSGYVLIPLAEMPNVGNAANFADNFGADGPHNAMVAFSLIGFHNGANPAQVQTALAHERGTF